MMSASLYLSLVVLLVATSATTLCLTYYGMFKHRAALWLSLVMVGLLFFALTIMVLQIGNGTPPPRTAPIRAALGGAAKGPRGLDILWQAIGSVVLVYSLPRFLLSAFGIGTRATVFRLLDAATFIVLILSAVRVTTGWRNAADVAALPNTILRILLFAIVGGALLLTLVFQARLPDRSLYKAVIAQIGALTVLVPFVVLEDLGLMAPPGFPNLAGQLLIVAASISAILHAQSSLKRPKYAIDNAPSPYFAERFGISERELEVVVGVQQGLSNNEIAERLYISPRTVEKHLYNIYQKAGIKNRLQLLNLMRSDSL